jgi:hypothetical protein
LHAREEVVQRQQQRAADGVVQSEVDAEQRLREALP